MAFVLDVGTLPISSHRMSKCRDKRPNSLEKDVKRTQTEPFGLEEWISVNRVSHPGTRQGTPRYALNRIAAMYDKEHVPMTLPDMV